jgi:hypothetical protein
MRDLSKFLLVCSVLAMGGATATAGPPATPFGQSSRFALDTNRIGFADSDLLLLTAAPGVDVTPPVVVLGDPLPNPFNPRVTIPYIVGRRGVVELGIFDARGRVVRTLAAELLPSGSHSRQWDGRDNRGSAVPAGVYLVRVKLDGVVQTRKVTLAK